MLSYTGETICRNTSLLSPVSFALDVQKPFLETYLQGLITWTQLLPSLSQSHVCTKQCPHHNESGHQLLCLTSSAILLLSYVGPHKGNPMLCGEGPFPSSGPVLQLLLADLALPTNTLHQQV